MKKILCMLFMAVAVLSFAQGNTKPEFQAFASSLLKLKPAEGGWQKFSLKVEIAPWAFQAIGEVHIVAGDAELLNSALYDGTLYSVVAYIPAPAAGTDGKEYQVGVFDLMLFLEDEPTQVRNVKFRLLPPANDEWAMGIFKDAIASGTALGSVWGGAYEDEIIKASAVPMDKKQLQANLKKKERPEPSPAAESAPVAKKKKKRSYDEDEEDEDGSNLTVKEKRRRAMMQKKREAAAEEAEEEEEPVVKKKRKRSYDEDEEEAPVVKKKKKKRSYDEDEEEAPVVKKKKKKKSYDEDEEEPVVKKKKKKNKKKVVYEDDEEEE
ncbi:MAG: hypothetical protein II819_10865 [Fibrobacter sp.]|nr:hypothetical protein [Fibrobacter sp.]